MLDNNVNTVWNTGRYAPAWITLDLGKTMTLDSVWLLPNMKPITSQVTHKIKVGTDATSLNTVWSYVGSSTSYVWLEADLSSGTVARYVQVYTEKSDSWVAWASINLYAFQVMHICGNGIKTSSEACDDGNTAASDGCSTVCTVECGYNCTAAQPNVCSTSCGDSKLAGNETCDDGNTISGDGRSANCSNIEPGWTCSTHIKTTSEACDDGSTAAGDGCSAGCTVECGYNCTAAQPNVCSVTCGDSKLAGNETCDDGNTISGDGCSADCNSVEAGWSCPPLACGRSSCTQVCGNGIKTSSEACDDGNTAASDGCSAVCSVECGYTCGGQPSLCYASAAVYVEMTLRLPLQKAFFTATALRQLSFRLAVAARAHVPENNVTIAAMEEVAAARRAVRLDIMTQVRVNDDAAATSLLSSWSTTTLNMHLKSAGLPDAILISMTVKKRPTDTVEEGTKQVLQSEGSVQPGAIRADEATKAVAASSILGAAVGAATLLLCISSAACYFFRRRYSFSTSDHANSHRPPVTDVVNITLCHALEKQHVSERDHMRYNVDGQVGLTLNLILWLLFEYSG